MPAKGKYYYIAERVNPQLKKPYYTAYGNTLTVKQAREKEKSAYGSNFIEKFSSEEEYLTRLKDIQDAGYTVYDRV